MCVFVLDQYESAILLLGTYYYCIVMMTMIRTIRTVLLNVGDKINDSSGCTRCSSTRLVSIIDR